MQCLCSGDSVESQVSPLQFYTQFIQGLHAEKWTLTPWLSEARIQVSLLLHLACLQSQYLVDAIKICCQLEMQLGWSLGRQL